MALYFSKCIELEAWVGVADFWLILGWKMMFSADVQTKWYLKISLVLLVGVYDDLHR